MRTEKNLSRYMYVHTCDECDWYDSQKFWGYIDIAFAICPECGAHISLTSGQYEYEETIAESGWEDFKLFLTGTYTKNPINFIPKGEHNEL